jgi:hypothetical protein
MNFTLVLTDDEVQQSNHDQVNEHDNPNASTLVLEFLQLVNQSVLYIYHLVIKRIQHHSQIYRLNL